MSEQAVTNEADGQESPGPEAKSELDQHLTDFDSQSKSSEPTPPSDKGQPSNDDKVSELYTFMQAEQARQSAEAANIAVSEAVTTIKGDDGVGMDDDLIEGILYRKASTDADFLKAFQNRATNTKVWTDQLTTIRDNLKSRNDTEATKGRNALREAVRTSSTQATNPTSAEDINKMSDAEFEEHKRSLAS